jgi:hypothetical protein
VGEVGVLVLVNWGKMGEVDYKQRVLEAAAFAPVGGREVCRGDGDAEVRGVEEELWWGWSACDFK